ncbi:glycosyltransferase family 2 protein [Candidatus Saccharibacteria bacterium]|nr:MAG: glycosyltransferase family 2 protein [Candidatus Saccharibacteria bacterium]
MRKTIKNTASKQPSSTIPKDGLSVIVPTYNGATWLPETVQHIVTALKEADITKCEIVVVNDGSTDDTEQVVKGLIKVSKFPMRLVTQKNGGRFVARRTGTDEARYPYLLFVDTRVFIGKSSLKYVVEQHGKDPSRQVWCSHVRVDKEGNIYARFWETVAFVAWRKYFKQPKDTSYGLAVFDDYPKGTTCFLIAKDVLADANKWFVSNTKDLKTSNDDTLLLRYIARDNSINISPDYWCLYHARATMQQYTKHVHHRGKVFVDGFLRNDGNRFFIPLIVFLAASVLVPIFLLIQTQFILPALIAGGAIWLLELVVMILLGVPCKDAFSAFILSPIFAVYYGAGIWRAFINIYITNRRSA